jgi:hypothetical protein
VPPEPESVAGLNQRHRSLVVYPSDFFLFGAMAQKVNHVQRETQREPLDNIERGAKDFASDRLKSVFTSWMLPPHQLINASGSSV